MPALPQPGSVIAERGEPTVSAARAAPGQPVSAVPAPALEEQFETIYATFYPRILRYLVRLLQDQELAQDAAQDTFLKAWRHLDSLKPNSRISSWLYTIARRTALDLLRHRALIGWQSLQGMEVADDAQARDFDEVEVAALLQRAFDLLPPQHKRLLAIWQGERPLDQVAAILQTTAGTAGNRLSRARQAWRRSYAARASEDHS